MNRRELLLGAMSLGLASGCSRPRKVTKTSYAGVEFKELIHPEADEFLPLIVAIHGKSGAPEHWVNGWMSFPGKVNIALPRGFIKEAEDTYSWFPWSTDPKDPKLATDVGLAEEKLWKAIAMLARGRRVMVAGFTEGAMLCYAIALRHPDVVTHAFPVVGTCPQGLVPTTPSKVAPITEYHGVADDQLRIEGVRDGVKMIQAIGGDITLREYPGIKHTATDKMHDDLRVDMQNAMKPK